MMEVENATTPTTTRTGKGTESEMVVGDGMQEELIHDESPSTTAAVTEVKYGYEEAVVQKHQHVDRNYLVGERKSDGWLSCECYDCNYKCFTSIYLPPLPS